MFDKINLQQAYQCIFMNNFSLYYPNIATLKPVNQEFLLLLPTQDTSL